MEAAVIGIVGSDRRGGTIDSAVSAALEGASMRVIRLHPDYSLERRPLESRSVRLILTQGAGNQLGRASRSHSDA